MIQFHQIPANSVLYIQSPEHLSEQERLSFHAACAKIRETLGITLIFAPSLDFIVAPAPATQMDAETGNITVAESTQKTCPRCGVSEETDGFCMDLKCPNKFTEPKPEPNPFPETTRFTPEEAIQRISTMATMPGARPNFQERVRHILERTDLAPLSIFSQSPFESILEILQRPGNRFTREQSYRLQAIISQRTIPYTDSSSS